METSGYLLLPQDHQDLHTTRLKPSPWPQVFTNPSIPSITTHWNGNNTYAPLAQNFPLTTPPSQLHDVVMVTDGAAGLFAAKVSEKRRRFVSDGTTTVGR
jgi:hypothetical protein